MKKIKVGILTAVLAIGFAAVSSTTASAAFHECKVPCKLYVH